MAADEVNEGAITWSRDAQVYVIHGADARAPRVGCLGGACLQREACVHYHRTNARHLSERMCIAGRADEFQRVGGAQQRILEES